MKEEAVITKRPVTEEEAVVITKQKSPIDDSINTTINDQVDGMVITNESTTTVPQQPSPTQQQQPIDMFKIQEEIEAQRIVDAEEQTEEDDNTGESAEDIAEPDIVHITVPKGEAKDFAQNMPKNLYDKFQASQVVQIEEVELRQIPTATRRISDISQYREICSRRPNHVVGELAERVLVNSGIVVTLKAASSIEQASIFLPGMQSYLDHDMEKVYQFMYTHTVDTSVGKLSYNEYKEIVSFLDFDTVLEGIYSISEHKEKTVNMVCTVDDEDEDDIPGCGGTFEYKINTNSLPDTKNFPEESMEQAKRIVNVKSDLEEAKKMQETSPASTVKVAKIGDRYFFARSMSVNRYIALNAKQDELSKYPNIIRLLLINVESIQIETYTDGQDEPELSIIDDVELLAEELSHLTDEELSLLKQFLVSIKEYVPMRYSIKGPYQCPLCGKVHKQARLDSVIQLLFQAARMTLQ